MEKVGKEHTHTHSDEREKDRENRKEKVCVKEGESSGLVHGPHPYVFTCFTDMF